MLSGLSESRPLFIAALEDLRHCGKPLTHAWRLLVEGVAENMRNKTISSLAERLLLHNVDLVIGMEFYLS